MVKWMINGCLAVTVWACLIAAVIGEGWQVAVAVFLCVFAMWVFVAMLDSIE